jgi:outer membrane lipoprotein SlyB
VGLGVGSGAGSAVGSDVGAAVAAVAGAVAIGVWGSCGVFPLFPHALNMNITTNNVDKRKILLYI